MKRILAGLILAASAAGAQQAPATGRPRADAPQARDSAPAIPVDARPPKGMCRIWIEGVAASQQPAPTDCRTAVKNRPANARVIFGDDYATQRKETVKTTVPPKGFTNVKPDVKRPLLIKPPEE